MSDPATAAVIKNGPKPRLDTLRVGVWRQIGEAANKVVRGLL
jgi:hypothetical protein